jgi:hypothetical protein
VDECVDLLQLGIHGLHQALVGQVLLVIRRRLDRVVADEGLTRLSFNIRDVIKRPFDILEKKEGRGIMPTCQLINHLGCVELGKDRGPRKAWPSEAPLQVRHRLPKRFDVFAVRSRLHSRGEAFD